MRIRSLARLGAVAALAVALSLAFAGTATAATGEPTLGLTALRAKLEASPTGTVTGYFKTVVSGSRIDTIPVDVLAVTESSGPGSSLILFEAQGPQIAKYGGIVEGMSGSPIYVDDGGTDKVIGAVSYGDAFTIGGSGLATPIESMLNLIDSYAPRAQELSQPVIMSGRVVNRVMVPSAQAGSTTSQAGTFVARPLASVFIGGLRPNSRVYANLQKKLEARGLNVVQITSALSAGTSTFSTDLVPGAAVAALATRGDMWVGGIGTVTYADGNNVLAYGHPAFYSGSTSLYLCNARIDGVWPSQYAPYKLGSPAAVRGEFTQDRSAGILGRVGSLPVETPVTAEVVDTDRNLEATSAVYFTAALLNDGETSPYVSAAASVAGSKLFDEAATPGSANTTTTVVVNDGKRDLTVSIANVVDDATDIPSAMAADTNRAVTALLSVLGDGLEQPDIVSIDFQASVQARRRAARVVDVNTDSPLHVGNNRVHVALLANGLTATQTVDTTLTIPAGTSPSGALVAAGTQLDPSEVPQDASVSTSTRQSIAQVVTGLNDSVPNNTLTVSLVPDPLDGTSSLAATDTSGYPQVSVTVPWVTSGTATTGASLITADVDPSTIPFRGAATLTGQVLGPDAPVTVSVFATPAGSATETLVATGTATFQDGVLSYEVFLPGLRTNMKLRVHIDGASGYTPADAAAAVRVAAHVTVKASAKTVRRGKSVTLTAQVEPGSASGSVRFRYYDGRRHEWRTIGTRSLAEGVSYARATMTWKPPKGTHKVHVNFSGDTRNVGATSANITIVTK